jgi:hypothetical protein
MRKCNIVNVPLNNNSYKLYVSDHSITCDEGFPWKVFTENPKLLTFKCHKVNANDFETYWKNSNILKKYDIAEAKIYRISLYLREARNETIVHEDKCSDWTETINVPWGEVYEINFQLNDTYMRFDCMASGAETEFGESLVRGLNYIEKRDLMKQHETLKSFR